MTGTRPVAGLAPLEYRYGLDAAMVLAAEALLATEALPPSDALPPAQLLVLCNIPELAGEVRQRLPHVTGRAGAAHSALVVPAALWIEPLTATWEAELNTLARAVRAGGRLVVIASQPLARLLPERSRPGGPDLPAGARIGGVPRLLKGLASAGFHLEARYGLHPVRAMAASLLGRGLERWGRQDLGDRLHFQARLHYCSRDWVRHGGLAAGMATVALLVASKVDA